MKRITPLLMAVAFVVSTSGCAIVAVPKRTSTRSSSAALKSSGDPECKPSQYWDGKMCRHKGKGHGARKHDG